MTECNSRREFLKGAAAITAALPASSRVLGANDRINVGFVGCGGRMNTHIDYLVKRAKERGDVQPVAVCDIYDKRKQQARERAGVDDKSVHHDFRELCARKDIDAVVIASPDHWHHGHAMAALRAGKDVYRQQTMIHWDARRERASTRAITKV